MLLYIKNMKLFMQLKRYRKCDADEKATPILSFFTITWIYSYKVNLLNNHTT